MSHPAWVCGLKQVVLLLLLLLPVTPCVGVWIETKCMLCKTWTEMVTPCVGVWIETYELRNALDYGTSHPAWVCGLKRH